MTTKHTPGPWRVRPLDGSRRVTAPDGHGHLATVRMRRTKAGNLSEMDGNAALIAAAPDLLAALQAAEGAVESILDGNTSPSLAAITAIHDAMLAAIAKATGA